MDPATLGGVALVASGAGLGWRRLRAREVERVDESTEPRLADTLAGLAGRSVGDVLDGLVVDLVAEEGAPEECAVDEPAMVDEPAGAGRAVLARDVEALRRQRALVERELGAALAEVCAARTAALRGASAAMTQATLARAARVRAERRRSQHGARASLAGAGRAHEARLEGIRSRVAAEREVARVPALRARASRLLAERRRLDTELARQAPAS
jgi:hypothetical protein